MDTNTTQTTAEAASVVNPIDDIASLLTEEEEQTGSDDQQAGPEGAEGELEGQQAEGEGEESGEGAEGEGEQSDEDLTWAKALGVDDSQLVIDEDGNLKGIQVKVDGEVSTVGVKDLIAGYQLNKHVTQKSQALAEERREFEQLREVAAATYQEKLQVAEQLTGYLNQSLLKEFNGINWEQLRMQNPGEYAALSADYQKRQAQIQQIHEAIKVEAAELNAKQQAEHNERYQEYIRSQYDKVIQNNPQWNDQAKMHADLNEIGMMAGATYGISPEEFAQLNDARYLEVLKDAIAYRKGKTVAEKKIQNVPKFQKSGSKQSKPMSKATQLALNARKATGYKQRDLQSSAIAELLMGNG